MKINIQGTRLIIRTIAFLSVSLLSYMIVSIDWNSADIEKRDIKPFIVYAATYYHPAADKCNAETCATDICAFCSGNYNEYNCPSNTSFSGTGCYTSCSSAYCSTTDHCVGAWRYTGKACNGSGGCTLSKGIIGCCTDDGCTGTDTCNTSTWTCESTDTCTCPGLNNNWEIDMADSCTISTNCDLGTGKLTFIGTGSTICNAVIETTDMGDPGAGAILYIGSSCIIYVE